MKKFKVVYIVSTLRKTGPINILYNLVSGIDRDRFDLYIVTLSPEVVDSRELDFLALGVSIIKMNLSRIAMMTYGTKKFSSIIDELQPDIIHSIGFRPDYYVLKYGNVKNSFSSIFNYPHKDYPMLYGKLVGNWMAQKQIEMIRKFSYPISCSYSVAKELYEIFGANTHVIHNGINIDEFAPIGNDGKMKIREELDIPLDKRVFLFIGTLIERKNPRYLIESYLKSNIVDDSILIIIGDGKLRDVCQNISNHSVKFVGNINDGKKYLKYLAACDIYVSASKAEGLPTAVIEAMSMGLPAILSNIPPHQEIIERNHNSGLLFPLENENALKDSFDQSRDFNIDQMSNCAQMCINEHFTHRKMSKSFEDYYKNAIVNN